MMVARRPPHRGRIVSVANACVEQGFYEIAADDIEESHRAGHDPEAVEKVFASIEGTVSRIMGAILQDGFPLPRAPVQGVALRSVADDARVALPQGDE